jgi:hypothetical protein
MAFEVDDWVASNYDQLVADKRRTYKDIEKGAEEMDDKILAGWARERAAKAGKSSPARATRAPRKASVKRTSAQPEEVKPEKLPED